MNRCVPSRKVTVNGQDVCSLKCEYPLLFTTKCFCSDSSISPRTRIDFKAAQNYTQLSAGLLRTLSCVCGFLFVFRYSEGVSSPHRHVRTRLYFTSESHIHSLLTILRYGGLCDVRVVHLLLVCHIYCYIISAHVPGHFTVSGFLSVRPQVLSDEQWGRAMEYIDRVSELNYMTQIVIMMYEDPTKVSQGHKRSRSPRRG